MCVTFGYQWQIYFLPSIKTIRMLANNPNDWGYSFGDK